MRISIDKSDISFDCEIGDTILRAAIRAGHGFPYECNVGSCGNCKFELLEGEVSNNSDQSDGLSDKDKQRNRYLGCQARPDSNCHIKVRLNDQYKSTHAPKQVSATVTHIVDLTHDIKEFHFLLDLKTRFLPGQYALIWIPGVQHQRAYSMSNVSNDGANWNFLIKRVDGGEATNELFSNVSTGQQLNLDGPYGTAYLREESPRDILCLAGGSGLAPMVSVARAAALSKRLRGRDIHFIYGGRTPGDICGEQHLSDLPGYNEHITYYPVISDIDDQASALWTGKSGFVHEAALDLFKGRLPEFDIYFAGPPAMADALQMMLYKENVPQNQVHFDKFY